MNKKEILSYYKGPGSKERKAEFSRVFNALCIQQHHPFGKAFNLVVKQALQASCQELRVLLEGITLNGGTANAVAAKLDDTM